MQATAIFLRRGAEFPFAARAIDCYSVRCGRYDKEGDSKMDVAEPRVRRRGFFLHSETGEPDTGEHENPEGVAVRARTRQAIPRQGAGIFSAGRSRTSTRSAVADAGRPEIRSGSVTGSRQRAHFPR